jgi:hypothetical protein
MEAAPRHGAAAAARQGEVPGGEACAWAARRCAFGGAGLAGGARVGAGWQGLGESDRAARRMTCGADEKGGGGGG